VTIIESPLPDYHGLSVHPRNAAGQCIRRRWDTRTWKLAVGGPDRDSPHAVPSFRPYCQ